MRIGSIRTRFKWTIAPNRRHFLYEEKDSSYQHSRRRIIGLASSGSGRRMGRHGRPRLLRRWRQLGRLSRRILRRRLRIPVVGLVAARQRGRGLLSSPLLLIARLRQLRPILRWKCVLRQLLVRLCLRHRYPGGSIRARPARLLPRRD